MSDVTAKLMCMWVGVSTAMAELLMLLPTVHDYLPNFSLDHSVILAFGILRTLATWKYVSDIHEARSVRFFKNEHNSKTKHLFIISYILMSDYLELHLLVPSPQSESPWYWL